MRELIKKIIPDFVIKEYRNYHSRKNIEYFQGEKVICPICKSRFRMFAPFGIPKRENALCPRCGSLERHRLLFLYLKDKLNLFDEKENLRLLHFGPEEALYHIFDKKQNIQYFPCDLVPKNYNFKGSSQVQKVDISNIPFEENFFDAILCVHVLEHIPDDLHAMAELYRVMKKGGWGILQVPIDDTREHTYEDATITTPKARHKAFGQYDHFRWYGHDYKDRLKSVGFKVVEDDYVKRFSSVELFQFGLIPSEFIYYCHK